ncbi:MAG: cytidine/deoxycytidylate deaminase family protein [Desulfovibrio sp.]|nr:cytidine/deoxycytidylate deaminase family protein [Desulfovibrio sp.]
MERLPWSAYFMRIVYLVAERSTCRRRQVGALAVWDNRIIATGYNGIPKGLPHCLEIGCLREEMHIPSGQRHEMCRGIHAEQNVIIQAATSGISLLGTDLYCTTFPCVLCCKMLINCGIKTIYYAEAYPDDLSKDLLRQAHIPVIQVQKPTDQAEAAFPPER